MHEPFAAATIYPMKGAQARSLRLHIGAHKTGSKSLQHVLRTRSQDLDSLGFRLFNSAIRIGESRVAGEDGWAHEIPLAIIRSSLDYPLRDSARVRGQTDRKHFIAHCSQEFQRDDPILIASHENLSFARFEWELLPLAKMLDSAQRACTVVLVLRDPASWLPSWESQLARMGRAAGSRDRNSIEFNGPQSWLFDWENLVKIYRNVFGSESLIIVNYEDAVKRDSSTVPSVLDGLGVGRGNLGALNEAWLNSR